MASLASTLSFKVYSNNKIPMEVVVVRLMVEGLIIYRYPARAALTLSSNRWLAENSIRPY